MADNPYFVQPANPLSALMSGVQGYGAAQKQATEDQLKAGRQEAMQALQSGGDIRNPLAKLIGIGDTKGAEAIATFAHQKAQEDLQRQGLKQTGEYQQGTLGLHRQELGLKTQADARAALQPVKLAEDPVKGTIYGVKDPSQPSGFRIIDINNMGGGGGAPAPRVNGPQAAAPGGEDASIPPNALPVQTAPTGRDEGYLKEIEQKYGPEMAAKVKKLADYDLNPNTFPTKGKYRDTLIGFASKYDPTYDQTQFPAKQQTMNKFTSGPQGNSTRSFNVAVSHLDTLQHLYDAMDNGNVQAFNSLRNKFREQFGSELPTNFEAARGIIGAEAVKAIVGAQSTGGERGESKETISQKLSPGQAAGVIGTYKDLFGDQMRGFEQQYKAGTGRSDYRKRFLFPETVKILEASDQKRATAENASKYPAAPPVGKSVNGFTYKGGDPNDKSSWEQAR